MACNYDEASHIELVELCNDMEAEIDLLLSQAASIVGERDEYQKTIITIDLASNTSVRCKNARKVLNDIHEITQLCLTLQEVHGELPF